MDLRQSFQQQHCFSKVALANFGFEFCLHSKLLRELYSIKPTGARSCLYDSFLVGLEHLRGLYQMIEESGRTGSWKLVHIIICDGRDGGSKNRWQQVKQAYRQAKARIRAYQFKTVVIAYNVSPQEYSQLLFLSQLDAAIPTFPASFFHSEYEELNLGKLMKRLRRDIGLLFKQPRQSDIFMKKQEDDLDEANPYAISEMKFSYAVLFNIAGSQQYDGEIWNSICNNVNNFTRYLGDRDILGGIIYAEGVSYFKEDRFILKEEKKKKIINVPPPPPPPAQLPPQNYAFGPNNAYQNAYVPPPYVDPYPQPPPRQSIPPPPKKNTVLSNQKPANINHSEKKSQSASSLVGSSKIDESKGYTMCEAGGKCRSCCACFLTLLVLAIIGGAIFLVVR